MLYDPTDPPRPPKPIIAPLADPQSEEALFRKIAETASPTRRFILLRNVFFFAASAILVAEVFYWWGGMRAEPRPAALIIETALGAACIAAVSLWAIHGRRKSMLGRSAVVLGVIGFATPALLLAWKIFWSSLEPGMMAIWPARVGLKCLSMSLMMGAFPLLAMALIRRNSDPNNPQLTGATLGVAAGACAWVFTDLWCPVAYVPHLLLGHVLPIAILAAAGAALGHWLIGVRVSR